MPTAKPRISVTLSDSTASILKEMSELTGNSQSAIVGELLEQSQTVFSRMVKLLRVARGVQESARTEIVASINAAQERVEAQLGLALDDMDQVERIVLEEAEAAVQRRLKRSGAGGKRSPPAPPRLGSPPISNRGVTPPQKSKNQGLRRGGGRG
jgi:hypothetical protein